MELRFTMKNYGTMEKNYGTIKKNYGTILRTMELRLTKEKKWWITKNFDLLW